MTKGDLFGDSVYESGDPVEDTDDLDPMEALTGDDPDEAMQTGYSPPDREPYNLRHLRTASEAHDGESLDDRLAEEEPDISADEPDHADARPRAGRLVAPDDGAHADNEPEEIAEDVGPAGYASSAEEAAMHIVDGNEQDLEDEQD
jgi:Family of unknown function (DUF5709)